MNNFEKITELKKQLKELNEEGMKKTQLQIKVQQELNRLQRDRLTPLVGIFFASEVRYFMVTDVPQEIMTMYGTHLNSHQIPIYSLCVDKSDGDYGELGEESLYSQCIEQDDIFAAFIAEGNTEITKEEFLNKVMSVVDDVADKGKKE